MCDNPVYYGPWQRRPLTKAGSVSNIPWAIFPRRCAAVGRKNSERVELNCIARPSTNRVGPEIDPPVLWLPDTERIMKHYGSSLLAKMLCYGVSHSKLRARSLTGPANYSDSGKAGNPMEASILPSDPAKPDAKPYG